MKTNSKAVLLFAAVLVSVVKLSADAQQSWDDQCASCHASNGNGKTKEGIKLHVKDYTDPKVQADFTDAGLLKNLMLGVGTESNPNRMPCYKAKLTAAEAKELIALIRSFKK